MNTSDPHRISGVIVRQLYLAPDVRSNIQRQIDEAIQKAELAGYQRGLQVGQAIALAVADAVKQSEATHDAQ
jgi:hypothetical protein